MADGSIPSSPSPTPAQSSSAGPQPTTNATVVTVAPLPAASPSSASGDLLLTALVSGAVIAAVLGGVVNTYLARRRSREEERARVRTVCAEALAAVTAYKEFPYAIRRRRNDHPADERIRLSEELRHVQERLSYYSAWMTSESQILSDAYETLLINLRAAAGTACHDAWLAPAAQTDADMNLHPGVIDLSGLKQFEAAYMDAVKTHLQAMVLFRSSSEPVRRQP